MDDCCLSENESLADFNGHRNSHSEGVRVEGRAITQVPGPLVFLSQSTSVKSCPRQDAEKRRNNNPRRDHLPIAAIHLGEFGTNLQQE